MANVTEHEQASELLARLDSLEAARATNQPENKRLVSVLSCTLAGYNQQEIYTDIWVEEARLALITQGRYVLPGWASVTGEQFEINDGCLDAFWTVSDIASATGVSASTVRRRMGAPDTRLGRVAGWRLSTIDQRWHN